MHAHDCEVSPCAVIKAKELVDGYKEAGYDGIVITNHFDKGIMHLWGETTEEHYQTYLRGYELAKEEGERVGLRVILGMEIRLECGPEDYLVYGVTKDFIREHMDICGCNLQELYEICEENGPLPQKESLWNTATGTKTTSALPFWVTAVCVFPPKPTAPLTKSAPKLC